MHPITYTAFAGDARIAFGPLRDVLIALHDRELRGGGEAVLVFEDASGRQVDFDLRGPLDEVLARAEPDPPRSGPGRPRLGVVSREVSLLPRHWDWLESRPNGISAALRRLVDEARNREPERERARLAREAASRFLSAMAGDRPGYEEACRALFAGDRARFDAETASWPADLRAHLERTAADAFLAGTGPG